MPNKGGRGRGGVFWQVVVGMRRGGVINISCGLAISKRVTSRSHPNRPLRFVFKANVLLPGFRRTVLNGRINRTISFALRPGSNCNRLVTSTIMSLPGGVFVISNGLTRSVLFINSRIPVDSGRNGHVVNVIGRINRRAIGVSFGRPVTNGALGFSIRVMSIHSMAPRSLRNNYSYKRYKSSYNNNYSRRGKRYSYR